MSFADRAEHEAEELKGKAKEKWGDATDNERLQAEGMADQAEAKMKQVGDRFEDEAHDVRDSLNR